MHDMLGEMKCLPDSPFKKLKGPLESAHFHKHLYSAHGKLRA